MSEAAASCLFPQTRWTLLHRLRTGTEEAAREALETLCCTYWQPLYCVARQKRMTEADAKDAVQGFFEMLLRRETFSQADEATGKLRQLLLKSFDNYCGQQWIKANRQKRGGGAEHVEFTEFFDADRTERQYLRFYQNATTPEALYKRAWAVRVLERSLQALRSDHAERGLQDRFQLLVGPLLQEADEAGLGQIATYAGTTTGALRVALHRMRRQYRELIERELAATLDSEDPKLIREELAELFKAFE